MPKKVTKIEEPVPAKKLPVKRGAKAIPVPEPVPVEPEEAYSSSESEEETAPEPTPAPKGKVKVKVKAEPKKPSLWMQTLQKHGFMVKGGAFKPTPKKGSDDYITVRAAFDAEKMKIAAGKQ